MDGQGDMAAAARAGTLQDVRLIGGSVGYSSRKGLKGLMASGRDGVVEAWCWV